MFIQGRLEEISNCGKGVKVGGKWYNFQHPRRANWRSRIGKTVRIYLFENRQPAFIVRLDNSKFR